MLPFPYPTLYPLQLSPYSLNPGKLVSFQGKRRWLNSQFNSGCSSIALLNFLPPGSLFSKFPFQICLQPSGFSQLENSMDLDLGISEYMDLMKYKTILTNCFIIIPQFANICLQFAK